MAGSYKTVDLFAGVGGLTLGFKQGGFTTILANDIDKNAADTFRLNHTGVKFIEGDIRGLKEKNIKSYIQNQKVDVLMAGIPCQSFSMSGYRIRKEIGQFPDSRHFLYREFFRMLDFLKPKVALIENVKGILSSNKGQIMQDIMQHFSQRHYKADFQLLDASDFGVPQTRQRVFIMANRIQQPNIFPMRLPEKISVAQAIADIPPNTPKS